MLALAGAAASTLLDLFWPEQCLLCAEPCAHAPWTSGGVIVPGLRAWDRPHLCAACAARLAPQPFLRETAPEDGHGLLVAAGRPACAELAALVGGCKYHGVRGAAWHLARLVEAALAVGTSAGGPVDALIAVPLHPTRQRQRGFNQAALIALATGAAAGLPVLDHVLRRRRRTAQQARLAPRGAERRTNVREAFAAEPPSPRQAARVALVDDLATSGGTLREAARALRAAGWDVPWGAVAGAAAGAG